LSVMCRSAAISTCKILKDCSWSVVQAINPYHTTYLWAASFHSHIKHYPHIRITLHNINSSIDKSWSHWCLQKTSSISSHRLQYLRLLNQLKHWEMLSGIYCNKKSICHQFLSRE
jgi:hypothetical protein